MSDCSDSLRITLWHLFQKIDAAHVVPDPLHGSGSIAIPRKVILPLISERGIIRSDHDIAPVREFSRIGPVRAIALTVNDTLSNSVSRMQRHDPGPTLPSLSPFGTYT